MDEKPHRQSLAVFPGSLDPITNGHLDIVEQVERDESVGEVEGVSDRFQRPTGRRFLDAAGFGPRRKHR